MSYIFFTLSQISPLHPKFLLFHPDFSTLFQISLPCPKFLHLDPNFITLSQNPPPCPKFLHSALNFSTLLQIRLPYLKFLLIYSYFSTLSQIPLAFLKFLHFDLNFTTLSQISLIMWFYYNLWIFDRPNMNCPCDRWKVNDINDNEEFQHYIFKDIKPYTRYVVYVQMYVMNMRSGHSAFSPYQYFMTDPAGECVILCPYSRLHTGTCVNVVLFTYLLLDGSSKGVCFIHIQVCRYYLIPIGIWQERK